MCSVLHLNSISVDGASSCSDSSADQQLQLPRALPVDANSCSSWRSDQQLPGVTPAAADANSYLLQVRAEAGCLPDTLISQRSPPPAPPATEHVLSQLTAAASADCADHRLLAPPSGDWLNWCESEFSQCRQQVACFRAKNSGRLSRLRAQLPATAADGQWQSVMMDYRLGIHASAVASLRQTEVARLLLLLVCQCWRSVSAGDIGGAPVASLSRWTFALLAALDKPVLADTASCLRQLLQSVRALCYRALEQCPQPANNNNNSSSSSSSRRSGGRNSNNSAARHETRTAGEWGELGGRVTLSEVTVLLLCTQLVLVSLVGGYFSQRDLVPAIT